MSCKIFIFLIIVLLTVDQSVALIDIPKNVRLDSEVAYNSPENFELFTVEEFVNKPDGSVHIRVTDSLKETYDNDHTSYFRVKELPKDSNELVDDFIMSYNHQEQVCTEFRLKQWQLKGLTNTLNTLVKSKSLVFGDITKDRTAIGPITLLQMVYANADKLKLDLKAFDEARFTEMYYFQFTIKLNDNRLVKIICLFPVSNVINRDPLVVGKTTLSQVITKSHPAIISVVFLPNNDPNIKQQSVRELYDSRNGDYEKLIISYYLVQERSSSKHAGTKLGRIDERNPFTLPAASGCGSTGKSNTFSIAAKQFSGSYVARGFQGQRYIAFDSLSHHLRLDSYGEYKMVYDLPTKRMTFMSHLTNPSSSNGHHINDDRKHCASSLALEDENDEGLYDSKTIEEVLGVDKYVALSYLGSTTMEDGTQCQLFERKISWGRIPLISKLNMWIKGKQSDTFYLVYYFIDELLVKVNINDNTFNELSYQSMWLKRLELHSRNPVLKYKTLNSQVTFSEFTWSLEPMAEESAAQNHEQSSSMHPVRLFDTIECKSTSDQMKLELIIKESKNNENKNVENKDDGKWNKKQFSSQAETIEEIIMGFLVQKTRLSRSQINELELVVPKIGSAASLNNNDESLIFVKAIIIAPMNYIYERSLVGWLNTPIESFPFERYGKFVKTGTAMTKFECSLSLATEFELKNHEKLYMIYCPYEGCAYTNDLSSFEYTKKEDVGKEGVPTPSETRCAIYLQTKQVDLGITGKSNIDLYSSQAIEKKLLSEEIAIDLFIKSTKESNIIQPVTFKGKVDKISLTKGLTLDSLGQVIKAGFCYSENMNLASLTSETIEILDLVLDKHQSVIQCHKACHFFPNCLTYSFNKATRTCTLTSIAKSYILNEFGEPVENQLVTLLKRDENNCNLYAPDTIHLYKLSSLALMTSMSSLNGQSEYYFTKNQPLIACSDLCHLNELNSNNKLHHCQTFKYFPLKSVCAIEDEGAYLFRTSGKKKLDGKEYGITDKTKYFMNLISKDEWFSIHHSAQYSRNYEQYYIIKDWTQIELKVKPPQTELISQTKSSLDIHDLNDAKPNDKEKITNDGRALILDASNILYDINREECLRECTLINRDCAMVDHCFHPINSRPTRYCAMYNVIRSNEAELTANVDQAKNATSYETISSQKVLDFIEGDAKNAYLTKSNMGCTHFRLVGDNLLLKQEIANTIRANQFKSKLSQAVEELASKDEKRSDDYLTHLKDLVSNYAICANNELGSFIIFVLLSIGLSGGLVLFVYVPLIRNNLPNLTTPISRTIARLKESVRGGSRRNDRLISKIEFNVELDDIRLHI